MTDLNFYFYLVRKSQWFIAVQRFGLFHVTYRIIQSCIFKPFLIKYFKY